MSGAQCQTYAPSKSQLTQIGQLIDPICTAKSLEPWLLTAATLVQPKADKRRLSRAFDKLVRRHNTLRIRFVQEKGVWRAFINAPDFYSVQEVDIGDVDDAEFDRRIREIALTPMPILSERLVELILVHCGARGDVVVSRVHHSITDGYGMIVLAEDLFKFMLGLPVLKRAISHEEYISKWQSPQGAQREKNEAYWQNAAKDFPKAPNVGRKAKGLPLLHRSVGWRDTKGLDVHVTQKSQDKFLEKVAGANVTSTSAVFSGFSEALCRCYNLESLVLSCSPSRTEPGLATYSGDHTLSPMFSYRSIPREDPMDRAKRQMLKYMELLENLPADSARRGSVLEQKFIAEGGYSRQFKTYFPRASLKEDKSAFRKGLKSKVGEVTRFGAFTFTSLDVYPRLFSVCELQVGASSDPSKGGFSLGCDIDAYTDQELQTLAETMCETLNLELENTVKP